MRPITRATIVVGMSALQFQRRLRSDQPSFLTIRDTAAK